MKKITEILQKGNPEPFGGLARTTYSTVTARASGGTLTLKNLEKLYKYLNSKKYAKKIQEQQYMEVMGNHLINTAMMEGVITDFEWLNLKGSIMINHALLVSPRMYKRLEPVAKRLEKERKAAIKEARLASQKPI